MALLHYAWAGRLRWPLVNASPQSIGMKLIWQDVGPNAACDASAGEVYLTNSPGKGLSLDECKKTCEGALGCQSITLSAKTGYCSHLSTACTNTKARKGFVALRLSADPGSAFKSDPGSTSISPKTASACIWRVHPHHPSASSPP